MCKSTKPEWRTTNVQWIYDYRAAGLATSDQGVYHSRYGLNRKRTPRSLETSTFEHARIKHAKLMIDVEKDRQQRANTSSVWGGWHAWLRCVSKSVRLVFAHLTCTPLEEKRGIRHVCCGMLAGKFLQRADQPADVGRRDGFFIDEEDAAVIAARFNPDLKQGRDRLAVVGDEREFLPRRCLKDQRVGSAQKSPAFPCGKAKD